MKVHWSVEDTLKKILDGVVFGELFFSKGRRCD